MTTITHFTKSAHVPSILNDGIIYREGHNFELMEKRGEMRGIDSISAQKRQIWKSCKTQYKTIGRYVWFTEEDTVCCIDGFGMKAEKTKFSFDAEAIGAKRWTEVRKKFMRSKKAKAQVLLLEMAAELAGDDTKKWWVTTHDVTLCDELTEAA